MVIYHRYQLPLSGYCYGCHDGLYTVLLMWWRSCCGLGFGLGFAGQWALTLCAVGRTYLYNDLRNSGQRRWLGSRVTMSPRARVRSRLGRTYDTSRVLGGRPKPYCENVLGSKQVVTVRGMTSMVLSCFWSAYNTRSTLPVSCTVESCQ